MPKLWAMWRAMIQRDFLTMLSYRGFALGRVVSIASGVLSAWFLTQTFLDREPDSIALYGNYFNFLVVGALLMEWTQCIIFGASGRIRSAQIEGSLESWVAFCPRLGRLILAESLAVQSGFLLQMTLTLCLAFALGLSFASGAVWIKLASVFLCWMALCPLGLWGGAFAIAFKRADPLGRAFVGLSWLLCGALYPVDVLPKPFWWLARCLPTTHALDALRAAFLRGEDWATLAPSFAALAFFAVLGWPCAILAIRWSDRFARRYGTLGQF